MAAKGIRPIYFVPRHRGRPGSTVLRAEQISQELTRRGLDARVAPSSDDIKDAIVVFLKGVAAARLSRSKRNRNLNVIDHIDPHRAHFKSRIRRMPWPFLQRPASRPRRKSCYLGEMDPSWIDGIIFVNSHIRSLYDGYGPDIPRTVILHSWDDRIRPVERAPGRDFVFLGESSRELASGIVDTWIRSECYSRDLLDRVASYRCHVNVRDVSGMEDREVGHGCNERPELRYYSKSNVKVSTAAAMNANIVCSPDPGSMDVLCDDYPYLYADRGRPIEDFLLEVKESMGSPAWHDGLEMMRMVKERTTLGRIADDYIAFFRSL